MSTLTAVVFAMWVLPIVGVGIAYIRLSRRVGRELAQFTENHAVADPSEARQLVSSPNVRVLDISLPKDENSSLPKRSDMGVSISGRVDVRKLNERRLFAVSSN